MKRLPQSMRDWQLRQFVKAVAVGMPVVRAARSTLAVGPLPGLFPDRSQLPLACK